MRNRNIKQLLNLVDGEKNHVFAIYDENDSNRVKPTLYALRHHLNLKVYDLQHDAELGKEILKNITETGIRESKSTLLFITKNFLSNDLLMFTGILAVMQCVNTKGYHRVIPLILDPCKKVPMYFQLPNCIPVWKYDWKMRVFSWKEELLLKELCNRIIKAFIGPPITRKLLKTIGKKIIYVRRPCSLNERIKRIRSTAQQQAFPCRIVSCLVHLRKLIEMLSDVVISCGHGQCRFICRGEDFLKLYNHREKSCEYIPRQCENCIFKGRKRLMIQHRQTCKGKKDSDWLSLLRPILPEQNRKKQKKSGKSNLQFTKMSKEKPQENDRKDVKPEEINEPSDQVNYVGCRHYGCTDTCLPKDLQHHLEHCCFKPSKCKYVDLGCPYDGPRFETDEHILHCEFRPEPCPNCGNVFQMQHLQHHIEICGTGKILSKLGRNLKEIFGLHSQPPESKISELELPERSTKRLPINDLSIPELLENLNPSGDEWPYKYPESKDEEQTRPLLKRRSSALEPSSPTHSVSYTQSISRPSAYFRQVSQDTDCNPPKLNNVGIARRRFDLIGRGHFEDYDCIQLFQEREKIRNTLY